MQQTTAPIRLSNELRASLRRDAYRTPIADLATQTVAAIRPSAGAPFPATGLPVDSQGFPYLRVNNPYEHTLTLTVAAVERFYELTATYPALILLSVQRYYTYGKWMRYYYLKQPKGKILPIRYVCENAFDYDVLLKGERRV